MRKLRLLLVLHLHIARLGPDLSLLLVLRGRVEVNEKQNAQTYAPAYNDSDLGRDISRRVFCSESLGPDNVASAVPNEI